MTHPPLLSHCRAAALSGSRALRVPSAARSKVCSNFGNFQTCLSLNPHKQMMSNLDDSILYLFVYLVHASAVASCCLSFLCRPAVNSSRTKQKLSVLAPFRLCTEDWSGHVAPRRHRIARMEEQQPAEAEADVAATHHAPLPPLPPTHSDTHAAAATPDDSVTAAAAPVPAAPPLSPVVPVASLSLVGVAPASPLLSATSASPRMLAMGSRSVYRPRAAALSSMQMSAHAIRTSTAQHRQRRASGASRGRTRRHRAARSHRRRCYALCLWLLQ